MLVKYKYRKRPASVPACETLLLLVHNSVNFLFNLDLSCNLLFFAFRKVYHQNAVFIACGDSSRVNCVSDLYRSAITSAAPNIFASVFIACGNGNCLALPVILYVDVVSPNTGHIHAPVISFISFFDVGHSPPASLRKLRIKNGGSWECWC